MRPLLYICILIGVFLIITLNFSDKNSSTINSMSKINIFSNPKNPINNDTIYIYRAYLIRTHPNRDIYGKWMVRMTAFKNCFEDEENEDFFVENPATGKKYEATIFNTGKCYDRNWAALCYFGTKYIQAIVPEEEVLEFGDQIIVHHNKRQVEVPVYQPPIRKPGLSVCVYTMYWYVDWPKLIEWVEIWRILGASHFYFYYQAITPEVDAVFRTYEEMGLATPIKAELMQSSTEFDPNPWLYRLGFEVHENDCLMRNEYQYMALLDVDEIILPVKNITMLKFLENKVLIDPMTRSWTFGHAGLAFDGTKMSHFKTRLNKFADNKRKFDWKKLDFSWLSTAHYKDVFKAPKTIYMTEKTDMVLTHRVRHMNWPYHSKQLSHEEAVYYHIRANWVATDNSTENSTKSAPYNKKLQQFFTESLRKIVHGNYLKVMNRAVEIFAKSDESFDPHYEVFDALYKCLGRWRNIGCSPYNICYANLSSMVDWVYANENPEEAKEIFLL